MRYEQPVPDYIKSLGDAQDDLRSQIDKLREKWQQDSKAIQQCQDQILEMLKSPGETEASEKELEEQGQRRLKEALKMGKDLVQTPNAADQKSFPLMKVLFGIAPADFRTGDMGSKAIHPSSPFSTRELRKPPMHAF